MRNFAIRISEEVIRKHPGVFLVAAATKVAVRENPNLPELLSEARLKLPPTKEELTRNAVVQAYRSFYWRIGVDPTKIRPSGEALARRLLDGKPIPSINNVVDAGNVASIETLVPIGIYDLGKIKGELILRFARDGEEFLDITGAMKRLEPHQIVLADGLGPIHIFPYRDAERTKIAAQSKEVLIIGCGVEGVDKGLVERAVGRVAELLSQSI